MTDYTKGTGSTGTLIIRDNGSQVQFIIQNTYSGTFTYGKSWSVTGGVNASGTFDISGAQAVVVYTATIGSTTTVTFNMGATGTGGLGGPTSLTVTITRTPADTATVPGKPTGKSVTNITQTSATFVFGAPSSNGGAGIDQYQIGWGTGSSPSSTRTVSGGTNSITGLNPNTSYHFWARAHNRKGWGAWSSALTAATRAGAMVKVNGSWRKAVPYVKVNGSWRLAQPYVKSNGAWKATS